MILLAFSCSQSRPGKDSAGLKNTSLIRGKFEQGKNHDLYLQSIVSDRFITIDTLKIGKDDTFSTRVKVDAPGFYALRNEDGKGITFVDGGNDTVNVEGNYYDFRYFTLSGSRDLDQITLLNEKTQDFLRKMEGFAAITNDSTKSPDYASLKLKIDKEYKEAFEELREFSKTFIENNKGSLITLLALSNQLGPRFYVFHPVNDMDLFLKTDSVLYAAYPGNEPVKALHDQLVTLKNQYNTSAPVAGMLSAGVTPPEINLPSPGGKNIKLSSTRGKVVLLDFWASWCPPCRGENPNLVKNYREYHSKGFEIYQVSLDKEKSSWIKAIKDDHLDWIHVSDLKYWNSMVVPLYNINSIPTNYLIDRDGKIIAANLRGEALSQKLNQIFNQ